MIVPPLRAFASIRKNAADLVERLAQLAYTHRHIAPPHHQRATIARHDIEALVAFIESQAAELAEMRMHYDMLGAQAKRAASGDRWSFARSCFREGMSFAWEMSAQGGMPDEAMNALIDGKASALREVNALSAPSRERGSGRIYRPRVSGRESLVWWIDYSVKGHRVRVSSGTRDASTAREILAQRVHAARVLLSSGLL